MGSIVAIVGRPNVGKSTLFNRLTGTRQAIVSEVSGTTRDRQYGTVEWNGRTFSLIDTGGWVAKSDDIFEGEIRAQVNSAASRNPLSSSPIRPTTMHCSSEPQNFTPWDSVSLTVSQP